MTGTVRARRNLARLLGLGLVAVSLLLIGSAATAGADGPQAQLTAKGWWWQAQQDGLPQPVPQPPNVATGQLWVQGSPNGKTAISAVRYQIGTGRVAQTLTLNVVPNGDQGGSTAVLIACQTGSAWTQA